MLILPRPPNRLHTHRLLSPGHNPFRPSWAMVREIVAFRLVHSGLSARSDRPNAEASSRATVSHHPNREKSFSTNKYYSAKKDYSALQKRKNSTGAYPYFTTRVISLIRAGQPDTVPTRTCGNSLQPSKPRESVCVASGPGKRGAVADQPASAATDSAMAIMF